jgi:hypothetical protein
MHRTVLVLGLALLLVGLCACGQQDQPKDGANGIPVQAVQKPTEPLASDGWATLQGRITHDGDLPVGAKLNINKDQSVCLCPEAVARGDDRDQTWLGKNSGGIQGVANVVVFLKPPDGKHFKIHDRYKDVSKDPNVGKVILDQPYCAFDPRVVVLYPSYYSEQIKGLKKSGQVFEVRNSAAVPHNIKIQGNPHDDDYFSPIIQPGDKLTDVRRKPYYGPQALTCDLHPWMKGYAWVLDHPYAARTDMAGNFKIEHVPAGAEVHVVIWHEGVGYYERDGFEGKAGKKMTFSKNTTEKLELQINKK